MKLYDYHVAKNSKSIARKFIVIECIVFYSVAEMAHYWQRVSALVERFVWNVKYLFGFFCLIFQDIKGLLYLLFPISRICLWCSPGTPSASVVLTSILALYHAAILSLSHLIHNIKTKWYTSILHINSLV